MALLTTAPLVQVQSYIRFNEFSFFSLYWFIYFLYRGYFTAKFSKFCVFGRILVLVFLILNWRSDFQRQQTETDPYSAAAFEGFNASSGGDGGTGWKAPTKQYTSPHLSQQFQPQQSTHSAVIYSRLLLFLLSVLVSLLVLEKSHSPIALSKRQEMDLQWVLCTFGKWGVITVKECLPS